MRFSNTTGGVSANLFWVLVLALSVGLSACGTKPKNLKSESGEPFPVTYPQPDPQDIKPIPLEPAPATRIQTQNKAPAQ